MNAFILFLHTSHPTIFFHSLKQTKNEKTAY